MEHGTSYQHPLLRQDLKKEQRRPGSCLPPDYRQWSAAGTKRSTARRSRAVVSRGGAVERKHVPGPAIKSVSRHPFQQSLADGAGDGDGRGCSEFFKLPRKVARSHGAGPDASRRLPAAQRPNGRAHPGGQGLLSGDAGSLQYLPRPYWRVHPMEIRNSGYRHQKAGLRFCRRFGILAQNSSELRPQYNFEIYQQLEENRKWLHP